MKPFKFIFIFLLLAISTITFAHEHNGTTYDECDDCPYWKMHYFSEANAKLLWRTAKEEPSSSITLTYGLCEGYGGEIAKGVLMVGFDPDSAFCNDPNYHPCHSQKVYGVAKISGSDKAFQAFFPGGIGFANKGWCSFRLRSTGKEERFDIGFAHRLQMAGGGTVENGAEQAGTEEATFKLEIKFYEETTDDEDNLLSTQELGNCSATINVVSNKLSGFNPTNLAANASSNDGFASIEKIERDFANDEDWSYSYTGTDWIGCDCELCCNIDVQAGPSSHYDGTSMLSSTETLYKVKIPGFEKPVIATPGYVSAAGWSVNISGGYILFNMPGVGDIKFHTGTDVSAASAGTYPCTYVEYPTNEPNDTGIRWRMSYNPDGTMDKMYRPSESDPNSIDTCYYDYSWDENGCMVIDYYNTDIDASNPIRTWSKCYDENGNLIESGNGGCSSCGGGSDYVKYEYYDPNDYPELEGLIKKKFNSDGDVILWNEYRAFDPNDGFYIVSPLIEEQYAVKAPGTAYEETVKFKSYTYDLTELSAIEKTWVDNTNYRVKKLYYSDNSFSDIEKEIEFATLNDNPANPTGDYYITEYELEDVNDVSIYVDGIKVHHRNFTRKYTSTNQTTPYRIDVSQYNYNFDLIQSYSYIDDDPNTAMGETDYKYSGGHVSEQTDWRGAKTTYSYSGENLLSQKEYLNSTDYLETVYTYYDGYRIVTETRKSYTQSEGYETLSYSEFNYNSDTFTRASIITYPDNSKQEILTSNEYKYNDFGEVIREKYGEGVVKGKRYDTAGKLESEFILANASDFNTLSDSGLSVVSQTCYTYDEMGRPEYVKRAVSDTSFTIDSTSVEWITDKYVYDWLGRRTQIIKDYGTGKSNLITETEYNNQQETFKTIEPSGKWQESVKDGIGRKVQSIIGYNTTDYQTTYYSYDDKGDMDEVIRQDGVSYFYGYDNFARKTSYQVGNLDDTYTTYSYDVWDLTGEFQWDANGTTTETDDILIKDVRNDYNINGRGQDRRTLATPGELSNTEDAIAKYTFDVMGNLVEELKYGEPNDTYPVYEPVKTENQYDGLGRLTRVIDADGNVKTYTYNQASLLENETNPSVSYEYDDYGRLEKKIDANGNYTGYSYNSLNQVIKETVYDCNGTPSNTADDFAVKQTRTQMDNVGRIEYTAIMKNPASAAAIDRSVDMVTDYVYDSTSGLLYQKKNYYNGSSSNVATTTYYYDDIDRNWKTVDAEGNEVRTYYDSTYNYQKVKQEIIQKNTDDATTKTLTVFYEYDSLGRLWKEIEDKDGDGVKETTDLITEYDYDLFGHKAVVTAPDGVVTEFAYNCMGNLDYKIEDPNDGNDNIDRLTDYGYDRLGNQISISGYDPNTQTTTYKYTRSGKVKKITYPDSSTIEYKYNSLGKVTEKKNKDDSYLYYSYDSVGNLITEADQSGSFNFTDPNCTATFRCEYEYDPLGQIVYFSEEKDDGFISDTEYAYNGFGLVEEESTFIKDCSEFFTTYTYDQMGNVLSRDHEDEEIDYTYDGLGRISTIKRNTEDIIAYEYLGNQTISIDFVEADIDYTAGYDELGRIDQCLYEDSDSNSILDFIYTYDDAGNRTSMKYNHMSPVAWDKYYYDNLSRLTGVEYGSTTAPVAVLEQLNDIYYLYQLAFFWLNTEGIDKMIEQEFGTVSKKDVHEVTRKEARDLIACYHKMFTGELPVVALSDTTTISESYDSSGNQLNTVYDENDNVVARIYYDSEDRITEFWVYFPNGDKIVVLSQYDSYDRTILEMAVQFDKTGDVVDVQNMLTTSTTTTQVSTLSSTSSLSLDSSITMMAASEPIVPLAKTDEYGYSTLGNRTTVTKDKFGWTETTEYTRNDNNQYTHINYEILELETVYQPEYDDNGNMTFDGESFAYTYDWRNRLASSQLGTTTVAEFEYDAIGRRCFKANSEKDIYYIYDTMGRVLAEYEAENDSNDITLARTFVYGNGIDEVLGMFLPEREYNTTYYSNFTDFAEAWLCDVNDTCYDSQWDDSSDGIINMEDYAMNDSIFDAPAGWETRFYYLKDALGSVRGLIGAVHGREDDREFYNYDVFGKVDETSDIGNPYYFQGRRLDEENQLYHYRNRTYKPETNQFLQDDPYGIEPNPIMRNIFNSHIQYHDGLNLRLSMKANAIMKTDTWGLDTDSDKETGCMYVACGKLIEDSLLNKAGNMVGARHCETRGNTIPSKIREDEVFFDTWIDRNKGRTIMDGDYIGTPCSCATCGQIKNCETYAYHHWNTQTTYAAIGNNCHAGVTITLSKCCLKTKWKPSWHSGSDIAPCIEYKVILTPHGAATYCTKRAPSIN